MRGWGGLTCSAPGPEQMWSRTPPPGNWLARGGLPVKEKRAAASEHRGIADADAGRWSSPAEGLPSAHSSSCMQEDWTALLQ